MEFFRPIQCYSCFAWCNHLRNECPIKDNPICSRCSLHGHSYLQCSNDFNCPNCQGAHPATARFCPEYSIAIEKHFPKIAAQLSHLNKTSNATTNKMSSDNAIGTDVLRAAALDSKTANAFLVSLFEACKIFTNSSPLSTDTYLGQSYSSLAKPDEIVSKDLDTSLDDAAEALNKEILLAAEAKADLPKASEYIPYPRALSNDIPRYDECQYGLTNNGIELIKSLKDLTQHASFKLKSTKNEDAHSNILYLQTTPNQNIVLCNTQSHKKVAIKPKIIVRLILYRNSVTLDTFDYGDYKLILDDEYAYSSSTAKELALWLKSHYDLRLVTR